MATRSLTSRSATSLAPARQPASQLQRQSSKKRRGQTGSVATPTLVSTATPTPRPGDARVVGNPTAVSETGKTGRPNRIGGSEDGDDGTPHPPGLGGRGFNIAAHLNASWEEEGSLSPDVDRLLKGLEEEMDSPPSTPPPSHPHPPPSHPHPSPSHPHPSSHGGRQPAADGSESSRQHSHVSIAANFSQSDMRHTAGGSHTSADTGGSHFYEPHGVVPRSDSEGTGQAPQANVPAQAASLVPKLLVNVASPVPEMPKQEADPIPNPANPSTGGAGLDPDSAAHRIQRWYRDVHHSHSQAVRSLLGRKRAELDRSRNETLERLQSEVRVQLMSILSHTCIMYMHVAGDFFF